MPFVLERVYGDAPLTAGLRLTVIPVALRLAAPARPCNDRHAARLPRVIGMLAVLGSRLLLSSLIDGDAAWVLFVTVALGRCPQAQDAYSNEPA